METKDGEKSPPVGRPGLIAVPLLILGGLLLAPPTRSLMQMQVRMIFDSSPYAARLRDLGVKEGPMPTVQKWEGSRPAALAAQNPGDYTLQLAAALVESTNSPASSGMTPQSHYANFQYRFGDRLSALAARFPGKAGPDAHYLRYMTLGTMWVSRDGEAEKIQTGKTKMTDRQTGSKDSWAAFDEAAARGEKIDPDNAYFPMMRAVGLFDAKRDAEGIDAVLRAGRKKRFEDYSLEEPAAAWTLHRQTYGLDSALLRESTYAALLLPHFSTLRAMARLTVAKAVLAEREGRPMEGLALRHAMMQSAVRMREGGSIISSLVGIANFSISTACPGGKNITVQTTATDDQKYSARRDGYLAYLRKSGQSAEAAWFAREDAACSEVRAVAQSAQKSGSLNPPTRRLPSLWTIDMLLLLNTLVLLMLCGAAALTGRVRGGEKALLLVAIVVLVPCIAIALQMQWAEAFTQMRIVLDSLSFSDGHQYEGDSRVTEIITHYPGVVHVGEVVISLVMPMLAIIAAGISGLLRRETFPAALSRTLQRGTLILTTLLIAAYAAALISTARLETKANNALDSRLRNEIAYLRQQNSK